jgi:nitroreductase
MDKRAITSIAINEFSAARWSPRAFLNKKVENNKLVALFEAARWSASGGNEQPWRFILGVDQDETWQKIYSCLDEGNQSWNKEVPVLILAMGYKISTWDGSVSDYYQYDTGQAVAHLSIEAMHQGLHVHQMGGFSIEKARQVLSLPDDVAPLTVIAAGYLGDPETLDEKQKKRELQPRKRKELSEFVFGGQYGKISPLLK